MYIYKGHYNRFLYSGYKKNDGCHYFDTLFQNGQLNRSSTRMARRPARQSPSPPPLPHTNSIKAKGWLPSSSIVHTNRTKSTKYTHKQRLINNSFCLINSKKLIQNIF